MSHSSHLSEPSRVPRLTWQLLPGLLLALLLAGGTATAVEPFPADVETAKLDRSTIYRYDPIHEQLWPIPIKSLKPGSIYKRYSPRLDRWVWSQAAKDGAMRYAFGPGSIQPAERFHLTVSQEEGLRELEIRAPELARRLEIQGGTVVMRLNADGRWQLYPSSCGPRIFDEISGRRWEWHGPDRHAVVHQGGDRWRFVDGDYRPAGR